MPVATAASRLGVSRRHLDRLLEEGTLVRLSRTLLAGSCLVERAATDPALRHMVRLHELLLTYDDCVATHESAAVLHGLPLLDWPERAIATRERGAWRGGDRSRVRIARLPETHLTEIDGWRCTDLRRTTVDIARCSSFRQAIVVGDAVLARGTRVCDLLECLEECSTWSDTNRARRAITFCDGRSESPLESVSRAIMHERELPPPEIQAWITGADGVDYRTDFYWKQFRLIGEADGLQKYNDIAVVRAEKLRQEMLERAGFIVVRWNFREMLVQTDATIERLARWMR